ncbi:hypothetical protein TSOC_001277, partial [Tetrabaena socialis]
GPAEARILTEAILSDSSSSSSRSGGADGDGGGGSSGAEDAQLRALMQLGGSPLASQPALAPVPPAGGPRAAPGTMVGTPNYAPRGPSGMGAAGGRGSTASEAAVALQLLASAREAVDGGMHDQALLLYSRLVAEHPDLALAEYGRIGRAIMLYQTGRPLDSILALEDAEVSMRGSAEVHAALAALLYSERPNLMLRAEEVRSWEERE